MNKKDKKKIYKYILTTVAIVCIAALLLWSIMFLTDYIRVSTFNEPIFAAAPDVRADDGGSGTYKGLGYKVVVEKYIDPEYGECLSSVEMWMFGRVIAAAIT